MRVTDKQYQTHVDPRGIQLTMISPRFSWFILIAVCACGQSDAPKTPLGAPRSENSVEADAGISGEAKRALDSGNTLFRAKDYGAALTQYERASQLAPAELSPLLGIMMVADVTHDAKLSGQTLPRIRKLNPGAADSAVVMPHSKIIEAHPRPDQSATGR